MKLEEAVKIGRFCGLQTVDECVRNIDMHALMLFRYTEMPKELEQLHEDFSLYLAGHYKLDIDKIDLDNQEEIARMLHDAELETDDYYESLEFSFTK